MLCQWGGTAKGIKSKVGGELELSLHALFTYLCDLCAFECAISLLILLFSIGYGPTHVSCVIRGLIACVHWEISWGFVFVGGGSFHFWRVLGGAFRALEEFWRALGGALRFWRPSRLWRCTSAGLVLFGGISKHWMCMCAFQHCKSWFESLSVLVHIRFIEH